jgi:hypothetical protein
MSAVRDLPLPPRVQALRQAQQLVALGRALEKNPNLGNSLPPERDASEECG